MPHPLKRPLLGAAVALVAAAMGLSVPFREDGPTVPPPPPPSTAPIQPYRIEMPADAFLHVTAEQDEIDLVLRLFDPAGHEILEVDSPTGGQGPEDLYFIAARAGEYRIEVRAWGSAAPEGQHSLRVVALRPATGSDRQRVQAETGFHRARALRDSDPEAAKAGFREAALLFEALGDPKRQGDSLFRLAQLTADPAASLDLLERAWTLYRQAGDRYGELAASNELGRRLEEGGLDLARAEALDRRAVELAQAVGAPRSEAVARTNLGKILAGRGESWGALSQLEPAIALWQSLGDPVEEAAADIPAASAYAALGKVRKGLGYVERALSLLPIEERRLRAAALTVKGTLLASLDDPEAARAALLQGLALRDPDDQHGQAVTRNSLGALAYRQGSLREALKHYQAAAALFEKGRDPRPRLATWVNQGWAHAGLGEFDRAAALFRASLEEARRSGIRPAEASALFGLAWIAQRRGREEEARRQAEASLDRIESLRNAESRELRASYLASNRDVYDFLIDLWMERHRRDPKARHDLQALAVSERSRGRSLLDELGDAGPVPIGEIQRRALNDGSLLLEYHLGKDRSFLWAVDSSGVTSYELPSRAEIETLTRRVLEATIASRGDDEGGDGASRELSRILLGPVAGRLRSLGDLPLRIAADGSLHALSFGALPDPASPPGAYEPLLLRHTVLATLSGSVLAAQTVARPRPTEAYGRLALIGDPVSSPFDERLLEVPALAGRPFGLVNRSGLSYARLPHARDELERIQSLAPHGRVMVRSGFDASRGFVLRGGLKDFDILHFASHASVDPEDGSRAALVLSLYDRNGRRVDGFLRARDIDRLDLDARLVVLSACQTGLGEDLRGEGQVGLAHSFLAAGADDVVASLWKVPDDRTDELMSRFYVRLLRDGLAPAQALRQAQLAAWRNPDYRAPYYWAGFMVQGRGAPAAPGAHRGAPPPPGPVR